MLRIAITETRVARRFSGEGRESRFSTHAATLVASVVFVFASAASANTAPVANAVTVLTTPQTATTVTLDATDADGDALDYVVVSLPNAGTVKVGSTTLASTDLPYTIPSNGNTLTYTSAATTHGAITFTYKTNDGTVDSSTATITVNVNQPPSPTAADVYTTPDKAVDITPAGTDPDEDTLAFTILTLPGHGVLSFSKTTLGADNVPYTMSSTEKKVKYTPDLSYHGPDAFTFRAADEFESSATAATISIHVNTQPAAGSFTVYVPRNTGQTITLQGADDDRDPIAYVILSVPAHGTLDADGTTVTEDDVPFTMTVDVTTVIYTPEAGYLGTDSFHYKTDDDVQQSALGVVTLKINEPPAAADMTGTADAAGQATFTLAPTDADGDAMTVTFTALPSHGQISIGGTKVSDTTKSYDAPAGGLAVVYQVAYDFSGTDSFAWQVSDAKVTTGPLAVTVTIPTAVPTPTTDEPPPDTDPTDDGSDLVNPEVDPCGAIGAGSAALMLTLGVLNVMSVWPRRWVRNLRRRTDV